MRFRILLNLLMAVSLLAALTFVQPAAGCATDSRCCDHCVSVALNPASCAGSCQAFALLDQVRHDRSLSAHSVVYGDAVSTLAGVDTAPDDPPPRARLLEG